MYIGCILLFDHIISSLNYICNKLWIDSKQLKWVKLKYFHPEPVWMVGFPMYQFTSNV